MPSTNSTQQHQALAYAAELIEKAGSVVIAAGAGMGTDSGLPDFRSSDGFWKAYPALRRAGLTFEDVAAAGCFDDDPYRAWGFYGHRLALYRKTVPHPGFALLKRWAVQTKAGYAVLTTNVDGQFQRAGFDPQRLYERHGSIHNLQCTVPCTPAIWSAEGVTVAIDASRCRWVGDLPSCPHCGALARPNILMFNDSSWVATRSEQQEQRLAAWLSSVHAPVVLEVGAGTGPSAIRSDAVRTAKLRKGQLIRINPTSTEEENADVVLTMPALRALKAMERILHKRATDTVPRAIQLIESSDTDLRTSKRARQPAGTPAVATQSTQDHAESAPAVGKRPAEHTLRRRLTLLSLLPDPGHPGISVKNLADKLKANDYPCSIRTVERDLAEMTDQTGVWKAAGTDLLTYPDPSDPRIQLWTHRTPRKPLMLRSHASDDALLIALRSLELHAFLPSSAMPASTAYQPTAASDDTYPRYREKISILPDGPGGTTSALDLSQLREVTDALLREEQIDLRYLGNSPNVEDSYRLHPIGLVKKGRFICLIAAKEEAGRVLPDPNAFRIDRVRSVQRRLSEPVAPTLPTLQEALDHGIPEFFPTETIGLVLRSRAGSGGDALMLEYAASPISEDQRIVHLPSGGQELSATVRYTREFVSMLQSQAHLVQVQAPAMLRRELEHFASLVAQQYGVTLDATVATTDVHSRSLT